MLLLRSLSFVLALLSIAPAPRAAQPAGDAAVTGRVLAPDGAPVTQGTVALVRSQTSRVDAAIDRTGHFRIVPDAPGWQSLHVSVPGYAPYRAYLTAPSSRRMPLPAITLLDATYFHARFVTADGEPLAASGLRRRTIDRDGVTIVDPLGHTRERSEADGSLTLGPLPAGRTQLAFDRSGHFRIVPDAPGWQSLHVSVPGYAPHRAYLTVPPSRRMPLPAITLLDATYFHARFVTADGEPLAASGLRRRTIDRDGVTIADPLGHIRERSGADGSLTLGPLPEGRTQLAFDRPGLAQTRLRDVNVTGSDRVIDGGTITIANGAQLHVDVIDGKGQPVPRHEVWLEEVVQPSPLFFMAARTNEEGRAVFERLAAGRYRVTTRAVERCGNTQLTVSRLVSTGDGGAARTRLVLGGRAAFRITSAIGPLFGRTITASPDSPAQPPWQAWMADVTARGRRPPQPRGPVSAPGCAGVTDSDGRVVLTSFPPGPAQLRIHLFNSVYIVRLAVPESGGEIVISVPDGLIPVRVMDRASDQPVPATLVWVGGGSRVEGVTNANGDALLEAAGTSGGTLTVSARDHETLEGSFDQTPETVQEVRLTKSPIPSPPVRVVNSAGEPIAEAVVQLHARGAGDADEFAAANAKGIAMFTDLPPGPLQVSAHADGFTPAAVRIAEDARASIVIALTPKPGQ